MQHFSSTTCFQAEPDSFWARAHGALDRPHENCTTSCHEWPNSPRERLAKARKRGPASGCAGLVAKWNIEHPDQKLLVGDRVVAVNGQYLKGADMVERIKADPAQSTPQRFFAACFLLVPYFFSRGWCVLIFVWVACFLVFLHVGMDGNRECFIIPMFEKVSLLCALRCSRSIQKVPE